MTHRVTPIQSEDIEGPICLTAFTYKVVNHPVAYIIVYILRYVQNTGTWYSRPTGVVKNLAWQTGRGLGYQVPIFCTETQHLPLTNVTPSLSIIKLNYFDQYFSSYRDMEISALFTMNFYNIRQWHLSSDRRVNLVLGRWWATFPWCIYLMKSQSIFGCKWGSG